MRGGKRNGAGRKAGKKTRNLVLRIPESLYLEIKAKYNRSLNPLIINYLNSLILNPAEPADIQRANIMETKELLNCKPVKISQKRGELMPTADLADTEMIAAYQDCGRGVAYIDNEGNLRAFNYGSKVELSEYDYCYVMLSATQVCFEGPIFDSLKKQAEKKNKISAIINSLSKIQIKNLKFYYIDNEISGLDKAKICIYHEMGFFERKHLDQIGKYAITHNFVNNIALLPEKGAVKGQIIDKNLISLEWSGSSLDVEGYIFYHNDEKYHVLLNPDVKKIEAELDSCFDKSPFISLSNTVKVSFRYNHPTV